MKEKKKKVKRDGWEDCEKISHCCGMALEEIRRDKYEVDFNRNISYPYNRCTGCGAEYESSKGRMFGNEYMLRNYPNIKKKEGVEVSVHIDSKNIDYFGYGTSGKRGGEVFLQGQNVYVGIHFNLFLLLINKFLEYDGKICKKCNKIYWAIADECPVCNEKLPENQKAHKRVHG